MKKSIMIMVIAAISIACIFGVAACDFQSSTDTEVKVIEIELTEESYAFGINKADTELLEQVNRILDEKQTQIDAIMNKFFNGGTPDLIASAKKDASKDQLIVATNSGFKPFEYTEGDKFAGIDMEIAKLIADTLGKELVIEDMDFDAVVTSVQNGQCDIAMAGLTVDAERSEMVQFSKSYYQASQVLIVRKSDTVFDACKTKADVDDVLSKLKKKKVGYQSGTTGQYYISGEKAEYEGFANLAGKGYDNAGLATQDMLNGNIDIVIVDGAPARAIARGING